MLLGSRRRPPRGAAVGEGKRLPMMEREHVLLPVGPTSEGASGRATRMPPGALALAGFTHSPRARLATQPWHQAAAAAPAGGRLAVVVAPQCPSSLGLQILVGLLQLAWPWAAV